MFTKQAIVATFPAYMIAEREADHTGYINITTADRLGLDSGKGFFREYSPGSVVSYALESGRCPIEAIERSTARKEALHWINACGSALTAHKQAQRTLVQVRFGMKVCFEGRRFTIESDWNNNLKLVPVAAEEKAAA